MSTALRVLRPDCTRCFWCVVARVNFMSTSCGLGPAGLGHWTHQYSVHVRVFNGVHKAQKNKTTTTTTKQNKNKEKNIKNHQWEYTQLTQKHNRNKVCLV